MSKRQNYLSWDEYFMGVALLSALRSKDPNTQVGCCIVNARKRIVGIGYNGMPYGSNDDSIPWDREGEFLKTKYAYVVHAEANAILNSNQDLENATLYVSLFPCNECAKLIVQSGIKEVVYMSDKYDGTPSNIASKTILKNAGVICRQIKEETITLNK